MGAPCGVALAARSQASTRARHGEGFQIFIKTLNGSSITLWVEHGDTIETTKRQLILMLGWIFAQPRDVILVLNSIQLEDARTLRECGITQGTQLTLIMRIRGGMEAADDVDPFDELDSSMPEVARPKNEITLALKLGRRNWGL